MCLQRLTDQVKAKPKILKEQSYFGTLKIAGAKLCIEVVATGNAYFDRFYNSLPKIGPLLGGGTSMSLGFTLVLW